MEEANLAANAQRSAESRARQMILALSLETGSKRPIPGGSVKSMTRLSYDRGAAYAFCLRKQMFLKLDEPAFEAFAKASPHEVAGIVREETANVAQIAGDLGKVLPSIALGAAVHQPEWKDDA